MDLSRNEILIGSDGQAKIDKSHVIVVGVGGVGGYAAMMLVRAGVGDITLVDFDVVSPSNINRQIVANQNTIGRFKVDVLKKMLLEINPKLVCSVCPARITNENVEKIITKCDYVIDAIDSVKDKVDLIKFCKEKKQKIISAMGAGNRYGVPHFSKTDIFKTHDDGLAKAVRKKLREHGIASLDVVIADEKPIENQSGTVGSISYYPAMCGITIAACVINDFLKEKE